MSDKERLRLSMVLWSVISVLTALFAAVYESMSHGVVSLYMTGAFAIPLLLGALTRAVLPALHAGAAGEKSAALWDLGVGTLLSGSLVQGVLEIYGTANRLTAVYPAAGAVLLAAGALAYCRGK